MNTRLQEFKIEGLFGLYSHRIALNLKERITIIIGPNGRGKTVCLKFIEALFRGRYSYFGDIPFRSAEFLFTDGETIRIERVDEKERPVAEGLPTRPIALTITIPGNESIFCSPVAADSRLMRQLRRYVPEQWEPLGPDLWIDQTDGEELTIRELAQRFHLPPPVISVLTNKSLI
jgi:hypothetical protein